MLIIGIPKKVQCVVITFVNDIINRVATEDINQLKVKIEQVDDIIEKELKERNVYLNKTKEQSILSFHGKGSVKAKGQLYTDKEHVIDDHIKYLGPQLEETGRCHVEVALRIREAQTAWDHYRSFWSKSTNLELKIMIFRNMILSTLMSGMISLNTISNDINRLHAIMMALARRSLAGRATIKDENAAHIIKKPEAEILTLMKLGSFEIELDIARLNYWQRIFREPNYHEQIITVVFGQFPFDDDFESYKENSRYKAFKASVEKIKNYDNLINLYYDLGDPTQLLLDEEL